MIADTPPLTTQPCPTCTQPMPVSRGFVTWCDHCNWNLRPQDKNRRESMLTRAWKAMGQRVGRAMVEEQKRTIPTAPRFSLSLLAAWLIATLVHAVTLSAAVGGVWMAVRFWQSGNWLLLLGALILLGVAWLTRPRIVRAPPPLVRADFPVLYRLADQIAERMNSPKVDGIVISSDYNAALQTYSLQRKTILELGLPLLLTLRGQEKVAVIAHEMAHRVNGDPLRQGWLESAIRTMERWVALLKPAPSSNIAYGLEAILLAIGTFISAVMGTLLSYLVYGLMYLFVLLGYRASQRAEYRADYLAAEVSTTNGVLRMLDKLYLASSFETVLQQSSLTTTQEGDIFDRFNSYVVTLPPRELERLRRANRAEGAQLDITHPPTAYRIEVLEAHPIPLASVSLSAHEEAQLEQELARFRAPIQKFLLNTFQRGLYY